MTVKQLIFYWTQGQDQAPDIVKRCWQAWADHNPQWQVQIYDATSIRTICDELNIPLPATYQAQADIFRVYHIARHGGLYIDAAVVPIKPLDDWLPTVTTAGFFAFHDPYRKRPIENWLLYSDPGHVLATRWLNCVAQYWSHPRRLQINQHELDPGWKGLISNKIAYFYKPSKTNKGIEPKKRTWSVSPKGGGQRAVHPYFWPHYLFAYLLETDAEVRTAWSLVPKVPSYKDLMLRHSKKTYTNMTNAEIKSIVSGSAMQKLSLKILPSDEQLEYIFSLADHNKISS